MQSPARLVLLVSLCALVGCMRVSPPAHEGQLVVGIRNSPAFVQQTEEGLSGYDYDLALGLAQSLGVKLRIVQAEDPQELVRLLHKGKIHIAASLPLDERVLDIRYTPVLRETRYVLAHHAERVGPGDAGDLTDQEVYLAPNSSAFDALNELPSVHRPTLITLRTGNDIDLLSQVADLKYKLAATDDTHFAIAANFHPDLRVGFELPGRLKLAWGVRPEDQDLYDKATAYIEQARASGVLAKIEDRYFGHIRRINDIGISKFLTDVGTRLKHYKKDFQLAQEVTGIDWRLLAALGYQESKWDPLATSFTGVRGIMMLTEDTAEHMGVANRLDPKESIMAGSKYLAELADDLPESVKPPDRMWLALAAYNLGMGHLNGGRQLAVGLKADPNSWYEMKKVLPLLSRPEYYARMKSGKARGGEAVIMVENIRTYYDILNRLEEAHKPG